MTILLSVLFFMRFAVSVGREEAVRNKSDLRKLLSYVGFASLRLCTFCVFFINSCRKTNLKISQ